MATGDLTQFGGKRVLPIWNYYVVSADGTPAGLEGACVVGSIVCLTAGTIAGAYSSHGAAYGTNRATGVALTPGGRINFANGYGSVFANGLYLDITGGTYVVVAIPRG
jgi:hypothetical protein